MSHVHITSFAVRIALREDQSWMVHLSFIPTLESAEHQAHQTPVCVVDLEPDNNCHLPDEETGPQPFRGRTEI